jgi:hypothetical protein
LLDAVWRLEATVVAAAAAAGQQRVQVGAVRVAAADRGVGVKQKLDGIMYGVALMLTPLLLVAVG